MNWVCRLNHRRQKDCDIECLRNQVAELQADLEVARHNCACADLQTQAALQSEKKALAERVNLSELRRVMTEWHQRAVALGFDGVPDLVASIEAGRPTNTPLRELIETHGEFLEANPYCYFELAYTRRTEWMAWICSKPSADDPNRKVIAQGQGSTPDDAAEAALAHMTPTFEREDDES